MQTLWENFPRRRQFEETHTCNTCRKKCNFCGKIFRTKGNMKKDILKPHYEKIAIFCGKNFQAEGTLKNHIKKNTCRKKCVFCEKILRTKGNLKKHILKTHVMKKKLQLLWENPPLRLNPALKIKSSPHDKIQPS